MKKYSISTLFVFIVCIVFAQQNPVVFKGATIHLGNGQVIEKGYLGIAKGKILFCSAQLDVAYASATSVDVTGKHIYPGIICMSNMMGLNEIEVVRATLDFRETGEINPNVRALIAYNTDSKITPTALNNGILFTQPVPQGGLISGMSSLMRTSGWNWEDAVYKVDDGVHMNWPEEMHYSGWWAEQGTAQQQKNDKDIRIIQQFFEQANQYNRLVSPKVFNARLDAMKDVLNGAKNLYVHAESAKSIIAVIQFKKQYPAMKVVLVDASDAWMVKEQIKENNIPVVLNNIHQLPKHNQSDVDQPYKTAVELVRAGITVAIGHNGYWEARNVMFNAGTTVAYGLSKEEALQCITYNAAKIIGVDKTLGSLETTKDATFIISSGDVLDMRTSIVERAFMDGIEIDLDNQQKQLYRKYKAKYNLK
ncbi:MAG: amidohydrolase family protein [Bacteroidota bacterium]